MPGRREANKQRAERRGNERASSEPGVSNSDIHQAYAFANLDPDLRQELIERPSIFHSVNEPIPGIAEVSRGRRAALASSLQLCTNLLLWAGKLQSPSLESHAVALNPQASVTGDVNFVVRGGSVWGLDNLGSDAEAATTVLHSDAGGSYIPRVKIYGDKCLIVTATRIIGGRIIDTRRSINGESLQFKIDFDVFKHSDNAITMPNKPGSDHPHAVRGVSDMDWLTNRGVLLAVLRTCYTTIDHKEACRVVTNMLVDDKGVTGQGRDFHFGKGGAKDLTLELRVEDDGIPVLCDNDGLWTPIRSANWPSYTRTPCVPTMANSYTLPTATKYVSDGTPVADSTHPALLAAIYTALAGASLVAIAAIATVFVRIKSQNQARSEPGRVRYNAKDARVDIIDPERALLPRPDPSAPIREEEEGVISPPSYEEAVAPSVVGQAVATRYQDQAAATVIEK